jgi:hypothetical protein
MSVFMQCARKTYLQESRRSNFAAVVVRIMEYESKMVDERIGDLALVVILALLVANRKIAKTSAGIP